MYSKWATLWSQIKNILNGSVYAAQRSVTGLSFVKLLNFSSSVWPRKLDSNLCQHRRENSWPLVKSSNTHKWNYRLLCVCVCVWAHPCWLVRVHRGGITHYNNGFNMCQPKAEYDKNVASITTHVFVHFCLITSYLIRLRGCRFHITVLLLENNLQRELIAA